MGPDLTELKRLRRLFHQHPEIGFAEFWTTARICEYLSALGCEMLYGKRLYDHFPEPELLEKWDDTIYQAAKKSYPDDEWIERLDGRTGVVGIIKGKKDGPRMGFRVDMDGLPIKESNDASHIPFKEGFHSGNGNMHACGHDGHITLGLGLAARLMEQTESLNGTVYIMFQPAEEVVFGGRIFSKLGFVKDLDYFFPVHVGLIDERKIFCGLSFLADQRFNVLFKGRSTHAGASPEKGNNALLAACNAVSSLYGMSRHSEGRSRINVGKFISDNASNVISDKARFELDLRGETNDICAYLKENALNIIHGVSTMYGVENDISFIAEAETAINSTELIPLIRAACRDAGISDDDIIDHDMISGSEDATFIMNQVLTHGGLTSYIGIGSPTKGGHHNETFDFDEEVLLDGVNVLFNLTMKLS